MGPRILSRGARATGTQTGQEPRHSGQAPIKCAIARGGRRERGGCPAQRHNPGGIHACVDAGSSRAPFEQPVASPPTSTATTAGNARLSRSSRPVVHLFPSRRALPVALLALPALLLAPFFLRCIFSLRTLDGAAPFPAAFHSTSPSPAVIACARSRRAPTPLRPALVESNVPQRGSTSPVTSSRGPAAARPSLTTAGVAVAHKQNTLRLAHQRQQHVSSAFRDRFH